MRLDLNTVVRLPLTAVRLGLNTDLSDKIIAVFNSVARRADIIRWRVSVSFTPRPFCLRTGWTPQPVSALVTVTLYTECSTHHLIAPRVLQVG